MEERAIPIYYPFSQAKPIHRQWNYRLAKRGTGASNLGYHESDHGGRNPLTSQIARYDFFRVEGHVGRNVDDAEKELEGRIKEGNLPFFVRKVLLHADKKNLAKRPIRHTDFHRLHYMLRTELASHLADSTLFNEKLKKSVELAKAEKQIPENSTIPQLAEQHFRVVEQSIGEVAPAMNAAKYEEYVQLRKRPEAFSNVVGAVVDFKSTVGENLRTDVATPFDGFVLGNRAAWLTWLDTFIEAQKERDEKKLLFTNFIDQHPAFEHLGGVPRGGTLVLLYGEDGRVLADGALPYDWREETEPENEPKLETPELKPKTVWDKLIQIRLPFENFFEKKNKAFEVDLDQKWDKKVDEKVNIQKDYFRFFRESLQALAPIARDKSNFADQNLANRMAELATRIERIDRLRSDATSVNVPADQQKQALAQLGPAQVDLADAITEATRYIVASKIDITADTEGGRALSTLANAVGQIGNADTRGNLKRALSQLENTPSPAHKAALRNLGNLIGR